MNTDAETSENRFSVNSFTQNLASVLTDTGRSRHETQIFFTRHWGDGFVPKTSIAATDSIPKVNADHFKHYLATTAKEHKHYLKSKRALRKALALHSNDAKVNIGDIPSIFLSSQFSLHEPQCFESVFLEPNEGDMDRILSENELRRSLAGSIGSSRPETASISRIPSTSSLVSSQSSQHRLPTDAMEGRVFRSYNTLQNRLEYYDDVVSALLNNQLESKSEAFWKTVNSYGALNSDLVSTLEKVQSIRENLETVKDRVYERTNHILELKAARNNRIRLRHRLRDIACLRDAQSTVQMLLNQSDFPRALECIETAQDVLGSELRGVVCFRHLNSQLHELHRAIGKMLQEEFVTLIQREFGKPIEREADCSYQEIQLDPVIHGLLRCDEFKFISVLRQEIVEAVKNTIRQIVKNRLIECEAMIPDYDPTLSLGEQMRRMSYAQWLATLGAVFNSLYFLCVRVGSIHSLIMENVERVERMAVYKEEEEEADDELPLAAQLKISETPPKTNGHLANEKTPPPNGTTQNGVMGDRKESAMSLASMGESMESSTPSAPNSQSNAVVAFLSMPCRNISQLKVVVPFLVDHAILSVEERVSKRLTTKYKDKFLESCSPENFAEFAQLVRSFVERCRQLVRPESALSIRESLEPLTAQRSPLINAVQLQTSKFIASFHESCIQTLSLLLDQEQWRPATVSPNFQMIVDNYVETGTLKCGGQPLNSRGTPDVGESAETLDVEGEKFVVFGSCLTLLRMMGQYCNVLTHFPQCSPELLMHLVTLLKTFNSRTCQLILGAGALQLVGLKTISVKTLALAARGLQLIVRFIPVVKQQFVATLSERSANSGRHFDSTLRDYNDHIEEIFNKLITVVDQHLTNGLNQWDMKSGTPSTAFQLVVRQIGKFYNGFASVMPPSVTTEMLHRIHAHFKVQMAQQMIKKQITPHDSLNYGMATQEFNYYLENMRAFPDCLHFPEDSLASFPI